MIDDSNLLCFIDKSDDLFGEKTEIISRLRAWLLGEVAFVGGIDFLHNFFDLIFGGSLDAKIIGC